MSIALAHRTFLCGVGKQILLLTYSFDVGRALHSLVRRLTQSHVSSECEHKPTPTHIIYIRRGNFKVFHVFLYFQRAVIVLTVKRKNTSLAGKAFFFDEPGKLFNERGKSPPLIRRLLVQSNH